MLQLVTLVTPSANTVQGLTPAPDAINSASPRPNKASPEHRTTNDSNGGRMVSGLGELQNKVGIFLIERNASFSGISFDFLNNHDWPRERRTRYRPEATTRQPPATVDGDGTSANINAPHIMAKTSAK